MRLADFISQGMEPILAQWEAFAASLLPAAANIESPGSRDQAEQIRTPWQRTCGTGKPGKPSAKNQWAERPR
ncbi:hypothetical protein P3T24_001646 [Paraburkholderia sp. GAS33]